MKNLLTFVLVAFLLVFTFQAAAVPKTEQTPAAQTSTGQREAAKLARAQGKNTFVISADRAAKIKPGKNKIFENLPIGTCATSGFV